MSKSRIKGILLQSFFHLRNSLEELIDTFFWPIMDVVIWGFMTSYLLGLKGQIVQVVIFLMSGLILWNIVWRAQQDISFTLLRNVWNRSLLNLFISPLTIWEFMAATMILGFLKILLTLAAVSVVAYLLYSFNIFALGFYFIPFFINLLIFAWAIGIFVTALVIRFGMRIQSFTWSFIVLLHPVSAVYYPVSQLPPLLQKIALLLPTAHIFEGMRQVLAKSELSVSHLVWAFGLNLVYITLSALFYALMYKKSRENGKLASIET